MSGDFTKGISFPSRGSILDRVQPQAQNKPLSAIQSEVDQLVGNAIATVSDEKMMASLFAAGAAGKFIRLGTVAASGKSLAPLAIQGISHATALAGESAVFAGMERKFAHWEGHAPTQAFKKDWARAAVNLGSIKFFGRAAQGENLIVQHLLIDSSMVAGHHAGYAFGVTDKPQGSIAQQMVQAEGMNLGMKGSLALLHGFSPRLSAMERSVDLALKSQETGLFSKDGAVPFFSQLAMATEGGPEALLANSRKSEGLEGPSMVFSKGDQGGSGGSGGASRSSWWKRFNEWANELQRPRGSVVQVPTPTPSVMRGMEKTKALEEALSSPDSYTRFLAAREAVDLNDPSLHPALERALADTNRSVRIMAAWALAQRGLSSGRQLLESEADPLNQPDPSARRLSVQILGQLSDIASSSVSVLRKTLESDPDSNVRLAAIEGFEKLLDPAARPFLEKILSTDSDFRLRLWAVKTLGTLGNPSARPALEKALNDPVPYVQSGAARALAQIGVKSLELAEVFHTRAMEFVEKADPLDRRDLSKLENYRFAMDLEWAAAQCLPGRNETLRGNRYVKATGLALKANLPGEAKKIILDALRDDFGAVAEDKLRRSAEKFMPWNKDRRFILKTLDEAKASLKLLEALRPTPALATTGASRLKSDPFAPNILMMSSREPLPESGTFDPNTSEQLLAKGYKPTNEYAPFEIDKLTPYLRELAARGVEYKLVQSIVNPGPHELSKVTVFEKSSTEKSGGSGVESSGSSSAELGSTPSLQQLNKEVTAAIFRAEHSTTDRQAVEAYIEVSRLEEKIADLLPPSENQGQIARRGVVSAAIEAGDYERARKMAQRYANEKGAPSELIEQLKKLLEPIQWIY